MKIALVICILLGFAGSALAQTENWEVYLAQYDNAIGSTVVDMALKQTAPQNGFSFVVVTGVKYKDCGEDGLPSKDAFAKLYLISDSIGQVLTRSTAGFKRAGTFTHQCQRNDYYYVTDTLHIRKALCELYKNEFGKFEPYINIKKDENWEYYLNFLYPSELIRNYMADQKVVMSLMNAGDKLDKKRPIDHWLYFGALKDLDAFIDYAKSNGFKIESKEDVKEPAHAFKLQISRPDMADLGSINKITSVLRAIAKQYNGDYDGWETTVVR